VLLFTAACGGDDTGEGTAASAPSESTETTSAAPSAEASDTGDTAGEMTLSASVGEPGDPEAFTITLLGADGEPVEELPAGEYEVEVSDPAQMHNFHLTGPGVDESTSVTETEEVTWTVTLEPGEYAFVCDPHPRMSGMFTVV